MRIVPFTPEHAQALRLRQFDERCLAGLGPGLDRAGLWRFYHAAGPGFTALAEGEVVACGGVVLARPGEGEGWALTGPSVPRHALSFHRAVARLLPALMEECGLARVTTLVHERHAVSRRWLRRLGFREEGRPTGRLGGETYYHCVKENPWQQQHP